MSNTTSLSSYEGAAYTGTGAAAGEALGRGAAALIGWLCEELAEDRAAIERRKAEEREERLSGMFEKAESLVTRCRPVPITTVPLKLTSVEPLVRSAQKLGYRLEPLASPVASLASNGAFLMRNAAGERLAITRTQHGRLAVHTISRADRVDRLVHQHNVDQATANLVEQGMRPQQATLANGETQILGLEPTAKPDGKAVVRLQVKADGNVNVDVDCVLGKRCAQIVGDLARAIGAEATATTKKAVYFEEPGEPVLTRVKA